MSNKSVITVSEPELSTLVDVLVARVLKDGFLPDVVLGIATGGAIVADHIDPSLECLRLTCTSQRPGTRVKSGLPGLRGLIRRLPLGIADAIRLAEDWLGVRTIKSAVPRILGTELDSQATIIRENGLKRILVVDDAVDSGMTLASVVMTIKKLIPDDVEVRTLAITRTREETQSLIVPDYFFFDRVLCRFHWSSDYRERS